MSEGGERRIGAEGVTVLLSLGAVAAAFVLRGSGSDAYAFVLGPLDPVATTLAVSVCGLLALRVLTRRGWFHAGGGSRRGCWIAVGVGSALTIPVIAVDVLGGFPPEMNVPAPASLAFYPSIAVVAEFAFHAVPLGLVALAADLVSSSDSRARWSAMALAALPEPVLQVAWGAAYSPVWANVYVGVHLLAFNLIGLALFRRHGFLTVYLYRLVYYAVWHVIWGHLRLDVLFG